MKAPPSPQPTGWPMSLDWRKKERSFLQVSSKDKVDSCHSMVQNYASSHTLERSVSPLAAYETGPLLLVLPSREGNDVIENENRLSYDAWFLWRPEVIDSNIFVKLKAEGLQVAEDCGTSVFNPMHACLCEFFPSPAHTLIHIHTQRKMM